MSLKKKIADFAQNFGVFGGILLDDRRVCNNLRRRILEEVVEALGEAVEATLWFRRIFVFAEFSVNFVYNFPAGWMEQEKAN